MLVEASFLINNSLLKKYYLHNQNPLFHKTDVNHNDLYKQAFQALLSLSWKKVIILNNEDDIAVDPQQKIFSFYLQAINYQL